MFNIMYRISVWHIAHSFDIFNELTPIARRPPPASGSRKTISMSDEESRLRAFQATRSLAGIRSNTLRALAGRRHLKHLLASAVAAKGSPPSLPPGELRVDGPIRGEVCARRAELEERRMKVRRTGRAAAGGGGGGGHGSEGGERAQQDGGRRRRPEALVVVGGKACEGG
jgi:hypothetical protein